LPLFTQFSFSKLKFVNWAPMPLKPILFLLLLVPVLRVEAQNTDSFRRMIDSLIVADSVAELRAFQAARGGARREHIVKYAREFMGLRYRRGGSTQKGFDCSGFTSFIFGHFGIRLPHTSAGQSLYGIDVPKNKLMKGDLLFFKGANLRRKGIGHVGIVISEKDQEVLFIHSSTSEGIRIDRLDGYYFRLRYVKAKRVLLE
jgi:cell wall-associated NlpC family hydrolase